MSNGKPTPGPWRYLDYRVEDANDVPIILLAVSSQIPHSMAEANGHVVAAAPDLLAALEALFSNPHIYPGDLVYQVREREGEGWDGPAVKQWSEAVMAAKAAIAKAKGGE